MIKLEILQNLAGKLNDAMYTDILKLLQDMKELSYIMTFDIPAGTYVSRIRESDKIPFNLSSQISYNPKPTFYGRANRPNSPVFYGSISLPGSTDSTETNILEWLGAYEREKVSNTNPEQITIGWWRTKEKISTIPIMYDKQLSSKTEFFKPLFSKYIEDKRITKESREIVQFLANQFAKTNITSHKDYKISAAFAELVFNRGNGQLNSILYPSVRNGGHGYNIAIPGEFVDKSLKLERVGTFGIYNAEGNIIFTKEQIVTDISDNGEFALAKFSNSQIVWDKSKSREFESYKSSSISFDRY